MKFLFFLEVLHNFVFNDRRVSLSFDWILSKETLGDMLINLYTLKYRYVG